MGINPAAKNSVWIFERRPYECTGSSLKFEPTDWRCRNRTCHSSDDNTLLKCFCPNLQPVSLHNLHDINCRWGGTAARIPNLSPERIFAVSVVNFTLRQLHPPPSSQVKSSQEPLGETFNVPQSLSGRGGKENISCRESYAFVQPVDSSDHKGYFC